MDSSLYTLVRIGQLHQKTDNPSAFYWTERRQFIGTCGCWQVGVTVVLLAPNSQSFVLRSFYPREFGDNLRFQDTFHTFVECFLEFLLQCRVAQTVAIRLFLFVDIT